MLVKGMSRLNWMSQSEQHILHTWCLAGCCVHYGRGSNSGSWWCPSKKWNGRNWTSHLSNIPGASLNVGVRSGRGSTLAADDVSHGNEVAELTESPEQHTWCLTECCCSFWQGKQLWKLMNWVSLNWVSQSEQHTWCFTACWCRSGGGGHSTSGWCAHRGTANKPVIRILLITTYIF